MTTTSKWLMIIIFYTIAGIFIGLLLPIPKNARELTIPNEPTQLNTTEEQIAAYSDHIDKAIEIAGAFNPPFAIPLLTLRASMDSGSFDQFIQFCVEYSKFDLERLRKKRMR